MSVGQRLRAPVAAAQGIWLRSTRTMAPPAAGPTSGTAGPDGGPPLRLAVLGESTAAGCGVERHEDGFTGSLARLLAGRTGRPVHWQVVGRFGATSRRIRYRLLPEIDEGLDVAVLLAGGNDVLSGRGPEEWRDHLTAVVDELLNRADQVLVAGTPPFQLFPSMPATLGLVLAGRAATLDEVSREVCAARPGTTWVTMNDIPRPEYFAADRFHLSAEGYRHWAEVIADHLVQ